ncbi:flagellar biosynthetic protein FliO [Thiolapillus brandeum]|uniref:Flagellar protein n=1 Tax=Thiolapillus brandeum TaxID=1076588 RepID=A0A7U6JHH3_9GAMM|nr:flagellar biosynthetic protein FliO [Thiolapillus brandeum]BAO44316.1 flagellar protein FliO/FliZ [Thiolapillus brandeum]
MHLFSYTSLVTSAPVDGGSLSGDTVTGTGSAGMDVGHQLVQVLGSLGIVLALVLVLAWLARRLSSSRIMQTKGLRLMGGISLGGKERIVLVQVGDRQLLIGVAPGNLRTLHVLDQPLNGKLSQAGGFEEQISQLMDKPQGKEG